ncbi:MAG: dolichyl-phosphate beta-glucosyltransferase [Candidatus Auribacterota bacterium]|nr:dolichyl-phosphate beta-glucosyltransferase [Candidatus Auribacterota bacterium]
MNTPKLSVIIPAYNEEKRLISTLTRIDEYLREQSYSYELIVVSDGSRDGTARVALEWCPEGFPLEVIDRKENRGKGYSVREGAALARGEYILFSDADLSTPIEEIEKFLPLLRGGTDIVIGSRSLRDSEVEVHQPLYRVMMGRVFNGMVQLLAVRGIIDTQCGFKCFSRSAVTKIFPRCLIEGFAFDVEILFLTRKFGLSIKEIPVRWINAEGSSVSPIRDSLAMFKEICQVRLNDWKGRYGKKG